MTPVNKPNIVSGEPVTITFWRRPHFADDITEGEVKCIKQGKVVDTLGDTIKVQHDIFIFGGFRMYYNKWYSFSDKSIVINIKSNGN